MSLQNTDLEAKVVACQKDVAAGFVFDKVELCFELEGFEPAQLAMDRVLFVKTASLSFSY